MPGLKDVKDKIAGVKKTSQITKAMNMVASAKLRGAQDKMVSFRPYAEKFAEAMSQLSGGIEAGNLPLMEVRDTKKIEIVVVTSDRGLCGSFNAHIVGTAKKIKQQYEAEGKEVSLVTVGKKATRAFRKTGQIRSSYNDIMGTFQMFNAREISQDISQNFIDGNSDQVDLVYSRFKSSPCSGRPGKNSCRSSPWPRKRPPNRLPRASGAYIYEPEPERSWKFFFLFT